MIEKKTKKNGSFYFSEKNNLTHMRVGKEDEREKKEEEERKELLCCFCRLSSREGHVVWSTDDWSERFFFVGFDRE